MEHYNWTDPRLGDFTISSDDPIGREMLRLARHARELERHRGELAAERALIREKLLAGLQGWFESLCVHIPKATIEAFVDEICPPEGA